MTLISENIFDPSQNQMTLLGGQSCVTGEIRFPRPLGAMAEEFVSVPLKREGTLWAYTVQRFPPGPPFIGERDRHNFEPYAVGYVELEDQVIIETRIVTKDFEALKVGLKMKLVLEEIPRSEGESVVTTYAFQPVQEMTA